MSSPEKREVPALQLSFVFGDGDARPQKPPTPPEDAEPQELPEMLCLSRTNLKRVTQSILKNSTLKVSLDWIYQPLTHQHPVMHPVELQASSCVSIQFVPLHYLLTLTVSSSVFIS